MTIFLGREREFYGKSSQESNFPGGFSSSRKFHSGEFPGGNFPKVGKIPGVVFREEGEFSVGEYYKRESFYSENADISYVTTTSDM